MYNPQEEKKQAKLFEKDFSPVALFLELVTTLFIINPNFLKKSQFFLKKATILFLFTNTSIIITYLLLFCYTQEKKNRSSYSTYLYTTDSTLSTTSQY